MTAKSLILVLPLFTLLNAEASPLTPKHLTLGVNETDLGVRDGLLDNSDDYRHSFDYAIAAGWALTPKLELDVSYEIPALTQDENRPSVSGLGASVHYFLSEGRLQPFAGLALKHLSLDAADSGIDLPGSLSGLGLKLGLQFDFSEHLFGRMDATRMEGVSDDLRATQYQLSLGYRFGSKQDVASAPERSVPPTIVEAPAVIEPPEVIEKPIPVPEPVVVVMPPDHDQDGVITAQDQCPDTPPGMMVNTVGCSPFDLALSGITFETNSAKLTSSSTAILDRIASDLLPFPDLKIEVQAHTDDRGSAQYNLRLSQLRAESVRIYLIKKGILSDNLIARGYGETLPKYDNETATGRAKNRRVELHFLTSEN